MASAPVSFALYRNPYQYIYSSVVVDTLQQFSV